ncbi:MAG TPA: CotH kinase family protein [Polyangiaceae bacterium]|nr:CotH kinase family protein [Polyangiaceae bacterium]
MSIRRADFAWALGVVGCLTLGLGCSGSNGPSEAASATGGAANNTDGDDSGGSSDEVGGTSNKSAKGGSSNSTKSSSTKGGSGGAGGSSKSGTSTKTSSPGGASGNGGQGGASKGGNASVGGTNGNTNVAKGGAGSTSSTPSNDACSAPGKGDVTMSVPSGTFEGELSLELSTSIASAQIRYTTDGSDPTASSNAYSSAIKLTKTSRVRAAAFVNGNLSGIASTALYVARSSDVTQSHDLPVIILDSYGSGTLPSDYTKERPFVDVAFLSLEPTNGTVKLADAPKVASLAAFHVRGNSSSMADKKPYRVELRAENGSDRDCPLVGMPSESDWALVSPHADKTLIHNNFVYELGRELGLQAPRVKLVEVYVNVDNEPLKADDYQGVYQLVETIKNQKNRLNLKQLDETKVSAADITGGYIFKCDWLLEPETPEAKIVCPSGTTNAWDWVQLIDPVPFAAQQKDYIANQLLGFHNALHGSSPSDASNGYPSYLEVPTFVDTVILNELTRNLDAYARSQYFFKDRDKKINAGPLWDFDLIAGVGTSMGLNNMTADGWQYESNRSRLTTDPSPSTGTTTTPGGFPGGGFSMGNPTADWFIKLVQEPTFKSQLIARWKELRKGPLADSGIATRIDDASKGASAAAERNFAKWNILTTATVNPFTTPTESTWTGQLTYMKTWLQQRAAWLDSQWK